VSGYDPRDSDSLPRPARSYLEQLDELPSGLRIAYSPTLGYARIDADVRRQVEEATQMLGRILGRPIDALSDTLTDVGMAWAALNAFQLHAQIGSIVEQHRDAWGRGFIAGVDLGARITAAAVGGFQRQRLELMDEVASIFDRYDLLLTPTLPTTAFAAGGPLPESADGEKFTSPIHAVAFTYPFNMTGHPAATVRAGFSRDELPIGLQLVATHGREDVLLQVARAYERERPFDGWPEEPRSGRPAA
jgi:aspartyl-tRNA(Asn)/glutamyl-tRNA(Gln) amidotransferase subunit A